jgi:hypothetical protein
VIVNGDHIKELVLTQFINLIKMKRILLLITLMLSGFTMSQSISQKDTLIQTINLTPGDELIKFEKQYNLGFGLSMFGTSISLVGTQQNDNRLIIGGGVLAVIGYFVLAQSHIHIKNAGLLMNQNGIGISIPLNKK